jgi:hypothetical protein
MATDPLLPTDDPPADPPRPTPPPAKKIVCEFCECVLAPSGDYVSLSAKAKALRAQEETIAALNDQIGELTDARDQAVRESNDAKAALAALQRQSETKRGFWGREVNT